MVPKTDGFAYTPRIELRSKECIDNVLKPLIDHINLPINGSCIRKYFYAVGDMSVDQNSVYSISKRYQKIPCETSIRHYLKKLNTNELMKSNEKILMHMSIGNLKTGKNTSLQLITPMIFTLN